MSEDEVIKEMVDEESKESTAEKKLHKREASENSSEGQYLGN